MMLIWLPFAVLAALAVVIVVLVWKMTRRRMLSGRAAYKVKTSWILIEQIQDPVRKILEADKVVDLALGLLGYRGNMGEKLKKAGPRFSDLQGLWDAHKLRNTIAHEMHATPSEQDVQRAMKGFERALRDVGMR